MRPRKSQPAQEPRIVGNASKPQKGASERRKSNSPRGHAQAENKEQGEHEGTEGQPSGSSRKGPDAIECPGAQCARPHAIDDSKANGCVDSSDGGHREDHESQDKVSDAPSQIASRITAHNASNDEERPRYACAPDILKGWYEPGNRSALERGEVIAEVKANHRDDGKTPNDVIAMDSRGHSQRSLAAAGPGIPYPPWHRSIPNHAV